MTKARRMIEEDLRFIDLVIEVLDARAPLSSGNPDIVSLTNGKARLIVMTKADLADPAATEKWIRYFRSQGITAVAVDARKSGLKKTILPLIRRACAAKIERDRKRGLRERPVRALVAGIPNAGKSTFINSFAGKGVAKTGNRPGVTKGKQWITVGKDVELMDSPGILWPKISDPAVGERLAMIGTIKDDLLDLSELAGKVLDAVKKEEPFLARYGDVLPDGAAPESGSDEILRGVAAKRGALRQGGEPDTDAASRILIEEFRKGVLGHVTLDPPPDPEGV